jgi:hypothetical protein
MLLKLALDIDDPQGHRIALATIVAWHKLPGEWVDYGDALCDLHVFAVLKVADRVEASRARKQIRDGIEKRGVATDWNRLGATSSKWRKPAKIRGLVDGAKMHTLREEEFVLRLTASDRGIMSQIAVSEGQLCRESDLLACFSTDGTDSASPSADLVERAPRFRIASQPVQWYEIDGSVEWWSDAERPEPTA